MLYRIARMLMTVALRLFYRRIYATGLECVAAEGPAIVIANHTSSLMDAALLGVLLRRPLYFFTRGDVFTGTLTRSILDALHMIPVHHHAGKSSPLYTNDESFAKAEQILSAGGIIVFFPEGFSHIERELKPFRKGVFRLAFQAAARNGFAIDIPIVPIGINYSHPTNYKADVMVHAGTPLLLNNYREEYLSRPAAALLHITQDSYAEVKKQVLLIHDKTLYGIAESCLLINSNDYVFFTKKWVQGTRRKLAEERNIFQHIQQLPSAELALLQKNAQRYFDLLSRFNINDETISRPVMLSTYTKLLLIIGFPFFAIGYLLNCLPILLAKKISDTWVYRVDYYSWIFVTTALLLYLIWLLCLGCLHFITGYKHAAAVVLLTMSTGIFVHHYLQWWRNYRQYTILRRVKLANPDVVEEIFERRKKIVEMTQRG